MNARLGFHVPSLTAASSAFPAYASVEHDFSTTAGSWFDGH